MAAYAAAGSAIVGGLGSYFGSKGDKVKAPDPYNLAEYQMTLNNPNLQNAFGGTRLIKDGGTNTQGEGSKADNTYRVVQTQTPRMQALTDRLYELAGASRGTFTSGGAPQGLNDIYAGVLYNRATGGDAPVADLQRQGVNLDAYRPSMPTYDRPQLGFGGTGEASTEADIADGLTDMSNREAYEWAKVNTNLGQADMDFLDRLFRESDGFANRDSLLTGRWDPNASGLNEKNVRHVQALQNALNQFTGAPQNRYDANIANPQRNDWPGLSTDYPGGDAVQWQPDTPELQGNYDQDAMARLLRQMGG